MKATKKILCLLLSVAMLLAGCNTTASKEDSTVQTALDKIDASSWNYNAEDDVYWQIGIAYCENPADTTYETLGIFVPGAYMTASDNGNGTYTCQINTEGSVSGYTAQTAPMVIPVDTPGYSAMKAPTDYVSTAVPYTDAGFIYVNAGCRGRDAGAPSGVTDLKAAIRYIRYNAETIPGNVDRIFSFGMSGGGAQSALLGATGDSELYTPYLEAIGAVSGVSDAVNGSMCWCPITNLDYANEAYEWNLGVSRSDLTEDMQQLSDGMAVAFAQYINALGLVDKNGNVLTLTESDTGIYQAGSYYDYLQAVVEQSLNNFLQDTSFPYEVASGNGPSGMGGQRGNGEGRPNMLPDGEMPALKEKSIDGDFPEKENLFNDDINRTMIVSGITLSGTYNTAQDYINTLNAEKKWVHYDSQTNTATITSIADFVKAMKPASKNIGAFDDLNTEQGENVLFGYGDGAGAHFDSVMATLLQDNAQYGESYASDLQKTDALGNTVAYRLNMYNPMYYLEDFYDGYQTAKVASYWRIRTGINQSDTALCTEINLALALQNYGVDVDFATVWGQGHVEAERTGNSTDNFIAWVNQCLQ